MGVPNNPNWGRDLIPAKPGETENQRKGGLAKTDKKHMALFMSNSRKAYCKNCPNKLECPVKIANIENDPNCVCTIPDARGKALFLNRTILTDVIFEGVARDTLDEIRKCCAGAKELKMYFDAIMILWNKLYPTVQKNVNVNIDAKDMADIWVEELFKEGIECEDVESVDVKLVGGEDTVEIVKEENKKEEDSSAHVE